MQRLPWPSVSKTYAAPSACFVWRQLPHLLVGNKSKLTRRFMSEIAEMPPSKLQVIRQDSAWLNIANMEQVLRLLKAALSPFMEEWQPLLLLDVAPAHLGQGFMALAATLGIELAYIPSAVTHLLQPLDVRGFRTFKCWLQEEWQNHHARNAGQVVCTTDLVRILKRSPQDFWASRKWARSFACVGAQAQCAPEALHKPLKRLLGEQTALLSCGEKPQPEDMQHVWPKRRRMLYACDLLFDRAPA